MFNLVTKEIFDIKPDLGQVLKHSYRFGDNLSDYLNIPYGMMRFDITKIKSSLLFIYDCIYDCLS